MKVKKDLSIKCSLGTSMSVRSPMKKSRWTRIETLDTEFAEKINFYSIAFYKTTFL